VRPVLGIPPAPPPPAHAAGKTPPAPRAAPRAPPRAPAPPSMRGGGHPSARISRARASDWMASPAPRTSAVSRRDLFHRLRQERPAPAPGPPVPAAARAGAAAPPAAVVQPPLSRAPARQSLVNERVNWRDVPGMYGRGLIRCLRIYMLACARGYRSTVLCTRRCRCAAERVAGSCFRDAAVKSWV
jgi:hypothetical protein